MSIFNWLIYATHWSCFSIELSFQNICAKIYALPYPYRSDEFNDGKSLKINKIQTIPKPSSQRTRREKKSIEPFHIIVVQNLSPPTPILSTISILVRPRKLCDPYIFVLAVHSWFRPWPWVKSTLCYYPNHCNPSGNRRKEHRVWLNWFFICRPNRHSKPNFNFENGIRQFRAALFGQFNYIILLA